MQIINKPFYLYTENGVQIIGQVEGNITSTQAIVLSHGFGVLSDSGVLFTRITELLKRDYLVFRFHYPSFNDFNNSTWTFGFSYRVEKLKAVINEIPKRYPNIQSLNIIGHSQGCIVTSLYTNRNHPLLSLSNIILLSPPINTDFGKKLKDYITLRIQKYKKGYLNTKGVSLLPRSAGNITYIDKSFWKDANKLNVLNTYQQLLASYPNTYFILPMQDTVLKPAEYLNIYNFAPKQNIIQLQNDHDYNKNNSLDLLKVLNEILGK